MNAKLFTAAACMAWTAAALSVATRAEALVVTNQVGDYGTCSEVYNYLKNGSVTVCGTDWAYQQRIKFISTACGAGNCSDTVYNVYIDTVYNAGRKTVSHIEGCWEYGFSKYGLGSCGC
jgi:hypothetical protein